MQRLQVQLDDRQVEELRRIAGQHRRSVAAVVRDAVDRYLADADIRTRRERAVAAVGGFRSGLGDLSEHHDRYLVEDAAT